MSVQPLRLAGKSGHGVLLIHGLTGAPAEMKPLAKRLARRGFEVAAPLLPGHGVDEATLLKTTWRDWLDGLCQAHDAFAAQVDTVHVAGVCVGGALGLMLAAERPTIRAAAVYSMTFEYDGWNMPRFAVAAPVIQLVANLPGVRRLAWAETHPFGLKDERLRALAERAPDGLIDGAIDRLPLGALFQMYRLGRHLEQVGKAITTPTLILHARDDDMSHPRNAYRLQRALGGATRLRLLEDSYHMIHVDQERDVVAAETASFFGAATPHDTPALGRRSHV
ncbi:MAG: alpha/beta fold hydrolase [Alphaproteobacteria bacterium]|nr:alpha/beta fold hydrolase [Alphaproteobacteria bacterium]